MASSELTGQAEWVIGPVAFIRPKEISTMSQSCSALDVLAFSGNLMQY
jgi:hypothetical protein